MAQIIENLENMPLLSLLADCNDLCKRVKAYPEKHEQIYKKLFKVLKSLVPGKIEILKAASSIYTLFAKGADNLAAYITDNWSTLMTAAGYLALITIGIMTAPIAIILLLKYK